MARDRSRQPLLHDLVTVFAAPTVVLSGPDGQLRSTGAHGVLHADLRVLSRAELTLDDREPEAVAGRPTGSGTASFTALARWLGDAGADPTVRVDRHRRAAAGAVDERVVVTSTATAPVRTTVRLHVAADLADVAAVKAGTAGGATATPVLDDGSVRWAGDGPAAGTQVALTAPDAAVEATSDGAVLAWAVEVPPRGRVELGWRLAVTDAGGAVVAAPAGSVAAAPDGVHVQAGERRLVDWVERSVADLDGLRMALRDRPDDVFVAAGIPWYCTLFGRDSLWAARMLLPLGTDLAAGTLRALAALQGRRTDPETGEEPGKAPHEVRRAETGADASAAVLPPLYYGTVDATPLWVMLLHDAWRWGLPEAQVRDLLPAMEAALGWLVRQTDDHPFLAYHDPTGRGLTNQGWKDSADAVRFADGTIATGPVALCEVQGYAHEAALAGARLLEAFGRPGADPLRQWASELSDRFRAAFWVGDGARRRPALALDGTGRPVDATTSNIGHLLGTGLLDDAETAQVARLVTGPDLDAGLGLRTMSELDAGYAPLSYHCGSVWPHDTAIVVRGLARTGRLGEAAGLVEGLLRAAHAFDARLPELWSGDPWPPVPYPAACRPQAWSAAAAVSVLADVLGLAVDVPTDRATAAGSSLAAALAIQRVDGLVVAGRPRSLALTPDGAATLH